MWPQSLVVSVTVKSSPEALCLARRRIELNDSSFEMKVLPLPAKWSLQQTNQASRLCDSQHDHSRECLWKSRPILVMNVSDQTLSRKFAQLELICQEIEIEISARKLLDDSIGQNVGQ
jgi:hypothetical protein